MQRMTGAKDKIKLVMTIVPPGVYLANSCNYILPTQEFPAGNLLGLLNSNLLNCYFRCFSTNSNVNGYEVEDFPKPKANEKQKHTIISLVDQILNAKHSNPNADTSALEREIDRFVYEVVWVGGGGNCYNRIRQLTNCRWYYYGTIFAKKSFEFKLSLYEKDSLYRVFA